MKREARWCPKQRGGMAKGRRLVDVGVWDRRSLGDWSTSGASGNTGILLGRWDGRAGESDVRSTCTGWNPGALQRDRCGSLHRAVFSRMQLMSVRLRGPSKALRWECWAEGQTWSLEGHLGSARDAGLEKCDGAWVLDCRCGQLGCRWGFTFRNKNIIGQALIKSLHGFFFSVELNNCTARSLH